MTQNNLDSVITNDIFDKPIIFDEKVKTYNSGKIFVGNMRLSKGLWRTDQEKETYLKQSLERQLP